MFRTFYPAALVLFLAAVTVSAQGDVIILKSPDGRIEFRLLDGPPWDPSLPHPHLSYQVDFNGQRLIDTSHLGYDIDNALPLGHKLGLMNTSRETVDETYTLLSGKSKTVRNHYNEVVAEYLQNGSLGRRLNIEARVFNDGVAFRYVIPPTMNLENFRSPNEITEFVFAKDADSYPLLLRDFQTPYEEQYSKLTLSRIQPESLVALPFLVQQPGVGWVTVTEADLDEYPGLYLQHGEGSLLHARLSPRVDGSGLALQTKTPVVSPWRVLLIADSPAKLIESNIVTSLNRPTKLKDTSWIQPGKAVPVQPINTATVKNAIEFAAASNLEYIMIESGWAPIGNGNVPDLMRTISEIDMVAILAQAKQRKVGVWLSTHWRSVESQMEEAFTQFEKWGVRGVKIDGMNRDDVSMVDFYHQAATKAAEHHLMVDFHGAYKPDGMQRTYPNVLTVEAVLGSEYAKSSAAVTPEHNVMLAFTRLLAGPMDYAPGGFRNVTREQFQPGATLGTRAHQLALYVIFESGLQMVADPESYKGEKDFDFLKAVPATWDETRALSGEVGQYVTIARSHGTEWYLGAITNWTPRELDVPLTFLGAGNYTAEIYSDGATPQPANMEQRPVTAATTLHLKLSSGGGAAVRFRRQ
ncbi:MAG: glycoside hydrolase family 97 protein [Bryobacteraceae bacterium]